MTFQEYQDAAHITSMNTDIVGNKALYPAIGLSDEAGEVLGKFKKLYRDKGGEMDEEFSEAVFKEISDVLWYVAELCTQLGFSLDDVAQYNIGKLADRQARGVIGGSGDDR